MVVQNSDLSRFGTFYAIVKQKLFKLDWKSWFQTFSAMTANAMTELSKNFLNPNLSKTEINFQYADTAGSINWRLTMWANHI